MTNSSHLSVFLGLQGSPLLNPPLFCALLVLLFYLAVQVWRGEAMEKHSILQACHERIHWLTSPSRSTMTNGLAIFRLTYGQQCTFPLSLASIERTVHMPFVDYANSASPFLQVFPKKCKYVIYNVSLTSSNNDPGLRSVNLIVVFVLACKTNTNDFLFHSRMLLHVLAADWITQSALSMFWVESMEINQLTFVLTFRLRELCGKRLLWRIKDIYDAISDFKVISSAFQKWIENLNSTWINDGIWSFVIQKKPKKTMVALSY